MKKRCSSTSGCVTPHSVTGVTTTGGGLGQGGALHRAALGCGTRFDRALPRWRRLGFNWPLQRLSRRRGGAEAAAGAGGGELDPDLSLHHQPHQLSTPTPKAETSSLYSRPTRLRNRPKQKGSKVIIGHDNKGMIVAQGGTNFSNQNKPSRKFS